MGTYCNICDKSFSKRANLLKHKDTIKHRRQAGLIGADSTFCTICNRNFQNAYELSRHDKSKMHNDNVRAASRSVKPTEQIINFAEFIGKLGMKYNSGLEMDSDTTLKTRSAFKKTIMDFKFIFNKDDVVEEIKVHQYVLNDLREIVKNFFIDKGENPITYQLAISAKYKKPEHDTTSLPGIKYFSTKQIRIQSHEQEDIETDILQLDDLMSEELLIGSGLVLERILFVELKIHPYRNKLGEHISSFPSTIILY